MNTIIEKCPACGGDVDLDDVDVNNGNEDGYGEMIAYHDCPHCGTELHVIFNAQDGYAFREIRLP